MQKDHWVIKPPSIVLWILEWYLTSSVDKKVRLLFQLNVTEWAAGAAGTFLLFCPLDMCNSLQNARNNLIIFHLKVEKIHLKRKFSQGHKLMWVLNIHNILPCQSISRLFIEDLQYHYWMNENKQVFGLRGKSQNIQQQKPRSKYRMSGNGRMKQGQ